MLELEGSKRREMTRIVLGVALLIGSCSSSALQGDSTPVIPSPSPTKTQPAERPDRTAASAQTQTPEPSATATVAPRPSPALTPTDVPVQVEGGKVLLGNRVLLSVQDDAPGCFDVRRIEPSPTGKHFVVALTCLEGDDEAFIFDADGSHRRAITEPPNDFVNYSNLVWSPDGHHVVYERVGLFGGPDVPLSTNGIVLFDVLSGEKTLIAPRIGLTRPGWSPDGRWLSFTFDDQLYANDMQGGGLWRFHQDCAAHHWSEHVVEGMMDLTCETGAGQVEVVAIPANTDAPQVGKSMPGVAPSAARPTLVMRPGCGSVLLTSRDTFLVQWGLWGAKGEELAQDNAPHLQAELRIDGRRVSATVRFLAPMFSLPCGTWLDDAYWVVHESVAGPLTAGIHTFEVTLTFDQEVSDGYDTDGDGVPDKYAGFDPIRQSYAVEVVD